MQKYISENDLILIIKEKLSEIGKITVAIDGRCASGKTTLGEKLAHMFSANLFHADSFFLRPEQRTSERLAEPGGNFDIERFSEEIISGINSDNDFTYSPFDCKSMTLGEKIEVKNNRLNIIEGSYSCHPDIAENYHIRVFVTTDTDTQKERIIKRNPDKAEAFFSKWIPLEEKYIAHYNIENNCDFILKT